MAYWNKLSETAVKLIYLNVLVKVHNILHFRVYKNYQGVEDIAENVENESVNYVEMGLKARNM